MRRVFRKLRDGHLIPSAALYLAVLLSSSHHAFAQYNRYQLQFNSITIENGLSNNKVNSITKDKYGFIWFATNDGVCRYDGIKVKTYYLDPLKTENINTNHINRVYTDREGTLWIGAFSLFKYDYELDTIVHYSSKDSTLIIGRVRYLSNDDKGILWIGSILGLFAYYPEKDSLVNYPYKYKVSSKIVSIFPEEDIVWIGTEKEGLKVLNRKTGIVKPFYLTREYTTQQYAVQCFLKYNKDIIWAGTYNNGILQINLHDSTVSKILPDLNNEISYRVRSLIKDDKGNIWVGSRNGLYVNYPGTDSLYHYAHSNHSTSRITDNSIFDIYIDNYKIMWMGTFAGGVNYTNLIGKPIYNFSKNESLPETLSDNLLYGFCEDGKGNIYIGTNDGGLNYFDKEKGIFSHFMTDSKNPCSIGSNNVKSIVRDKSGNLWVGLYKDGVNYFDIKSNCFKKLPQLVKPGNSLISTNVYSLVLDEKENLWIASDAGIDVLNIKEKTIKSVLKIDQVMCLYKDHLDRIWAGVEDVGIFLYDSVKKTFKPVFSDLIKSSVRTILLDSNGNLWLGGNTGLSYINTKDRTYIAYYQADGMPTNLIMGILEDNHKNLWVSTSAGLVKCIDMVNHPETFNKRIYTVQDGLQNKHFLNYSYYKSSTGELYFGGIKGFSMFQPDSIKDNPYPPQIALTDLKIFNKSVKPGQKIKGRVLLKKTLNQSKKITLSYRHRIITIDFTALHYVNAEYVRYKYMIYPFEKNWNYSDASRPFVTYTNLPGGTYTFRVTAANSDGLWNEEPHELTIVMLSPFWKTAWFIGIVIIIVIASFFLIYRRRVDTIQKQKDKLEMMVNDRTKTITEMNDLLKNQTKELRKTNHLLAKQKDQITEQADELEAQKEELLIQKEMLQDLNSMKDRFFSIIAHDLKGPFQGIIGLTDILIKNYDDCSYEEKKNYITAIHNSSKNFYNLLENLLYWARTQLDHVTIDPSEFNLVEIIEKNKKLLEENYLKKNINILDEYQSDAWIYADINMIDTVVRNLISNAIKFSHEGGTIYIRISGNASEKQFSVKDMGTGMTKEEQNNLFQIDKSNSKPGTSGEIGTGLGLILCHEFVIKNGGNIWVESESGKGSTFYFTLPAKG